MSLFSLFHHGRRRLVRASFRRADLGAGTEAWPAIRSGRHVLIAAPTGSGKTLAAFLAGDRRAGAQGLERAPARRRDADRLCLAAEGAVERHPEATSRCRSPGSPRSCAARGLPRCRYPHLGAHRRHALGRARRRCAKKPPHIVVTTPESLYLLLGSESGRAHAGDDALGHRRRDARAGVEQARQRISRCRSNG